MTVTANYLSLLRHFKRGFFLSNRNFPLLLIFICLSLIHYIISGYERPLIFINILVNIILYAISFSLPELFVHSLQNKEFNLRYVTSVLIKNAKRIVLPFLAIILLITILLGILIVSLLVLRYVDADKSFLDAVRSALNIPFGIIYFIYYVVISVLGSLFIFTSIYFSLEKQPLFKALKTSFIVAIKRKGFTICFFTFLLVLNAIYASTYAFSLLYSNLLDVVFILVYSYVGFVLTASVLSYYQKNIAPKK